MSGEISSASQTTPKLSHRHTFQQEYMGYNTGTISKQT